MTSALATKSDVRLGRGGHQKGHRVVFSSKTERERERERERETSEAENKFRLSAPVAGKQQPVTADQQPEASCEDQIARSSESNPIQPDSTRFNPIQPDMTSSLSASSSFCFVCHVHAAVATAKRVHNIFHLQKLESRNSLFLFSTDK